MRCFHGTTADNLAGILANGILASPPNRVWNCSADAVYFWGDNLIQKEYPDEDEESQVEQLRRAAIDSGSVGLGVAKDCRIVLVEFEVPDDEVETDDSCENMEYANCIYRDVRPEEIRRIEISEDFSLIRGYFIGMMLNHDLSGLWFSELEKRIGQIFKRGGFDFYEFTQECKYVEVPITRRIR